MVERIARTNGKGVTKASLRRSTDGVHCPDGEANLAQRNLGGGTENQIDTPELRLLLSRSCRGVQVKRKRCVDRRNTVMGTTDLCPVALDPLREVGLREEQIKSIVAP